MKEKAKIKMKKVIVSYSTNLSDLSEDALDDGFAAVDGCVSHELCLFNEFAIFVILSPIRRLSNSR